MTSRDDLFRPTVRPQDRPPPWYTPHLYLTAFFGGPAAVAALGVVNARRLRAEREVPWIAASGIVGIAAIVTMAIVADDPLSVARITTVVSGLAVYAVTWWRLRGAERVFALTSREHASLLVPAVVAILGGVALSVLIIVIFGSGT